MSKPSEEGLEMLLELIDALAGEEPHFVQLGLRNHNGPYVLIAPEGQSTSTRGQNDIDLVLELDRAIVSVSTPLKERLAEFSFHPSSHNTHPHALQRPGRGLPPTFASKAAAAMRELAKGKPAKQRDG